MNTRMYVAAWNPELLRPVDLTKYVESLSRVGGWTKSCTTCDKACVYFSGSTPCTLFNIDTDENLGGARLRLFVQVSLAGVSDQC